MSKTSLRRVDVALPQNAYSVWVGGGATQCLGELIEKAAPRTRQVVLVSQPGIPALDSVMAHLGDRKTVVTLIESGEKHKSLATVETLCRSWADANLTRADLVVAVGGGMVTDVAGFAAAVYHRGIAVIHVSTSLIGMIDAAIGGKTGVNLPQGKNLVGAFWQPSAVICDLDHLDTLSEPEMRSGYGELAKYGFLPGGEGLNQLDLLDQVELCVKIKAGMVSADERENGQRALLNYGHTLAHAIETVDEYSMRHGEAVAVGMIFAAQLAHQMGRISIDRVDEHRQVVNGYGLPTRLPAGIDHNKLLDAMGRDKKATDGLVFVLDGPSGVEVVPQIDPAQVMAAFVAVEGPITRI